jgi:NAD(P)-dependent dehydrogenase (short-subunit alcohol dehydrogenase family)
MSSQPKVALITGASSGTFFKDQYSHLVLKHHYLVGIGRATAIALSEAGWALVLFARRMEQLRETQAKCSHPDKVLLVHGDVTDEQTVVNLFKSAVERFGMYIAYAISRET